MGCTSTVHIEKEKSVHGTLTRKGSLERCLIVKGWTAQGKAKGTGELGKEANKENKVGHGIRAKGPRESQSFSHVQLVATAWTESVAHEALYPWNSPGKNTGVGCHSFLQGIFLTQG